MPNIAGIESSSKDLTKDFAGINNHSVATIKNFRQLF